MKEFKRRFTITPSVVPCGKTVTLTIKGHGEYYRFFDDVEYTVRVIPREYKDYSIDDDLKVFHVNYNTVKADAHNGVLSFDYKFEGEQEWSVSVKAENKDQDAHIKWMHTMFPGGDWCMHRFDEFRFDFLNVYSLNEDLYGLKAYKGDTHTHTEYSDGRDTPELLCSHYRSFGYDFVAITDHYEYLASLRAIDKIKELPTGLIVFPGEEIHVKQSGLFHMVNFCGKSSVNTKIYNNYEQVKDEVKSLAKKYSDLTDSDALEVAWTEWITTEIRKSGGISIYPHPYWTVNGIFNHPTYITKEIFKHKLFDVFEIINGGLTPHEMNLQTNLYYEMRSEGYKFPIVGGTDAHNGTDYGESSCAVVSTCTFAKSPKDIPQAIMDSKSTAVSHIPGENEQVYGDFRLVRYTRFLLENYFPKHNELCKASGIMMSEYLKGYQDLKPAIELAEQRITEYEIEFFGK